MTKPQDITYLIPPMNKLPLLIGVYVCEKENVAVYVGQSENVIYRVVQHWGGLNQNGVTGSSGGGNRLSHGLQKNFDKVLFYPESSATRRTELEEFLLWKHRPRWNKPNTIPKWPRSYTDEQAWAVIRRDVRSRKTHNGFDPERRI